MRDDVTADSEGRHVTSRFHLIIVEWINIKVQTSNNNKWWIFLRDATAQTRVWGFENLTTDSKFRPLTNFPNELCFPEFSFLITTKQGCRPAPSSLMNGNPRTISPNFLATQLLTLQQNHETEDCGFIFLETRYKFSVDHSPASSTPQHFQFSASADVLHFC